ncbi:phosphatidylinositol-4-phosphate 5-kinase [Anaeramoeba flamelloides]|uniref:Phosphatidylinositol-4-phosphate 5-kinase n=1 Tax=Anaeramoeba flamelloides TaxID=1746091 RepID=A0ABQ8YDX4_9EUKA|nr:phosphatidylinositol-4-phosphate 5-kinase [Anaeramoeba flamelloides]
MKKKDLDNNSIGLYDTIKGKILVSKFTRYNAIKQLLIKGIVTCQKHKTKNKKQRMENDEKFQFGEFQNNEVNLEIEVPFETLKCFNKSITLQENSKCVLEFTEFSPNLFSHFRKSRGISEKQFLQSMTSMLPWRNNGGRSGAYFFLTKDHQFVIKCLRETDSQNLRNVVSVYTQYQTENKDTLLVPFFGHFQIKSNALVQQYVVMLNIFHYSLNLNKIYDLKGSTHARDGKKLKINRENLIQKEFLLKNTLQKNQSNLEEKENTNKKGNGNQKKSQEKEERNDKKEENSNEQDKEKKKEDKENEKDKEEKKEKEEKEEEEEKEKEEEEEEKEKKENKDEKEEQKCKQSKQTKVIEIKNVDLKEKEIQDNKNENNNEETEEEEKKKEKEKENEKENEKEKVEEEKKENNEDQNFITLTRVLKDNDLDEKFHFTSEQKNLFVKILKRDSTFLQKQQLMDYSFLVGIHYIDEKNEKEDIVKRKFQIKPNTSLFRKQFGGILGNQKNSHGVKCIYYFGIIDMLTYYSVSKIVERQFKGLIWGDSISLVSPKPYSKRFVNTMGGLITTNNSTQTKHLPKKLKSEKKEKEEKSEENEKKEIEKEENKKNQENEKNQEKDDIKENEKNQEKDENKENEKSEENEKNEKEKSEENKKKEKEKEKEENEKNEKKEEKKKQTKKKSSSLYSFLFKNLKEN